MATPVFYILSNNRIERQTEWTHRDSGLQVLQPPSAYRYQPPPYVHVCRNIRLSERPLPSDEIYGCSLLSESAITLRLKRMCFACYREHRLRGGR